MHCYDYQNEVEVLKEGFTGHRVYTVCTGRHVDSREVHETKEVAPLRGQLPNFSDGALVAPLARAT